MTGQQLFLFSLSILSASRNIVLAEMGRSVLSDVCNGMSLHTPQFSNCGIFRGPTFSKNFLQEWFQLKGKTHPRLN